MLQAQAKDFAENEKDEPVVYYFTDGDISAFLFHLYVENTRKVLFLDVKLNFSKKWTIKCDL